MIQLNVSFEKGIGTALLNAVRAESFVRQSVVRPIGFKIGSTSNILDTPECVIEDMTTFISSVDEFCFVSDGDKDCIVATCVCDGDLSISDLVNSSLRVVGDGTVLHSTQPVEVSVVFRKACGAFLNSANSDFMIKRGLQDFVAVNSRHSTIETFTAYKVGESDDIETFAIEIATNDGSSSNALLRNAVSGVIENASKLLSFL